MTHSDADVIHMVQKTSLYVVKISSDTIPYLLCYTEANHFSLQIGYEYELRPYPHRRFKTYFP
jgi:hypothetical protein